MRARTPDQVLDAFVSKFEVSESGCWEWVAARTGSGYGCFWTGEGNVSAHRYGYKAAVDPDLPDDLTLDHLCRNKGCVNPDHLEPVAIRVNILRSTGPCALNAIKTHCIRGHEFTEENTYWHTGGTKRTCRTCEAIRHKSRLAERRKTVRDRGICPDCGEERSLVNMRRHRIRMHSKGG